MHAKTCPVHYYLYRRNQGSGDSISVQPQISYAAWNKLPPQLGSLPITLGPLMGNKYLRLMTGSQLDIIKIRIAQAVQRKEDGTLSSLSSGLPVDIVHTEQ